MTTLYHYPMSAPSRFIRLIFGEYGIESALVEEHPWARRREFLALNPAGTVPVLVVDGGHALCGATVVAEYVDETHGAMKRNQRLLPENPFERGEVRRLIEWFLQKMEHDVTRHLVRERVDKLLMPHSAGGGAPDSKALRTARTNVRQHMKYLNWLAGTRSWLAGERLSYADLAAAGAISTLDYLGEIPWGDFPQAKDWYQRLKSRPAFRPLLAERVRGTTPVSHYADLDF